MIALGGETAPAREPVRSLKVALLSPCFWPEVRRGGERFTRELADGLLARGHHPELITSHPGAPRRTVEDGLPILRLPRPPSGARLRRMFEPYVTHVPLSYAALRLGDYDLAHAVYPTDALAAARWRKRTGRPAILSYMGIPTRAWVAEQRRRQVLGVALRGCDAVVALSRYAARAFEEVLGYQAPVIAPGVDLEAFRPGPGRARRPTIICGAAAEEPRKHVALLVEALALVRRERADAELVLSRPRDLEAVRRAGVRVDAPGVRWVDLDDREILARAYAAAWVSALPSEDEAFGLVLAEAMACGTPAVGYHGGAIPEVIDRPGVGLLFDRLDPAALSRTLLEAMELSRLPETGARCRARAEELSSDRCAESYLELYRQLGAG
ncbi:MAG TPA: glycosyltransferase family 4 protein [Solirubrobacteraceae bacterium]|nr:glycosyltransferase family 4 protein [Solirubrobacteraceae bacterium]